MNSHWRRFEQSTCGRSDGLSVVNLFPHVRTVCEREGMTYLPALDVTCEYGFQPIGLMSTMAVNDLALFIPRLRREAE